MNFIKVITLILLVLANYSYGFDWQKCKKIAYRLDILGPFLSTSSYASSSSECSMVGDMNNDKKFFLVQNYIELQEDIAKGGGLYLGAYASLMECTTTARDSLPKVLQSNFVRIYGDDMQNESYEATYKNIDKVIIDSGLGSDCNLRNAI